MMYQKTDKIIHVTQNILNFPVVFSFKLIVTMSNSRSSTSPEPGSGGNNQRNPEPGQNPNDSTGNPAANSTTTPQPAAPTNIPGVRTTATVVTRNTTPTADDLANKRLLKEIKELNESPVEGVAYATPQKNNLFLWDVAFFGAPDTPYQGGYFKVRSSV